MRPQAIERVGNRAARTVAILVVGGEIIVLVVGVPAAETSYAPETHDDRV
jgi:hypothetical protein